MTMDTALTAARQNSKPRVHRLVQIHYLPRVMGALYTFIIILAIQQHKQYASWIVPMAILHCWLWPHIAYFWGKYARDGKRAELNNLAIEAGIYGAWVAILRYDLWIVICLLMPVFLNNVAVGNVRQFLRAMGGFICANVAVGLLVGFQFDPVASQGVALAVVIGSLLYAFSVGYSYHWQNRSLAKTKRLVENKNTVFQSLLKMSAVTQHTDNDNLDTLLDRSLKHFSQLLPHLGFGVIVHDHNRTGSLRHMAFHGIDKNESNALLAQLFSLNFHGRDVIALPHQEGRGPYFLLPMEKHLKQFEGVLVIKGQTSEEELHTTISLFLDQIALALENTLLTMQLKKLANTDSLTGVHNRTFFEQELAQAKRNKANHVAMDFALISIDVNGLKEVNDNYGHGSGDKLLITVSHLLAKICRSSDVLVRLGGDEFVILCHGCNDLQAQGLIRRIRQEEKTAKLELMLAHGQEITLPIRLSIGLANSKEVDPDEIMKLADQRMYADKRAYYQTNQRCR